MTDVMRLVEVNVQPESIRGLLEHARLAREIAHACQPPGAGRVDSRLLRDVVRAAANPDLPYGLAQPATARDHNGLEPTHHQRLMR